MIVIISDLHFHDGTASPKNVNASAFALLMAEIDAAAQQSRARSVDLVLLGDIFELLRTTRWFEDAAGVAVPLAERPWWSPDALTEEAPPSAVLRRTRGILDEIIALNDDAFSHLRAGLPSGLPLRRIYVPGNHDRLCLHDEGLLSRMRAALGAESDDAALAAEGITRHAVHSRPHQLLARHGHEWDEWNFERYDPRKHPGEYLPADFLPAPVGDPITTELVARLPWEVHRRLAEEATFRGRPELEQVLLRLQRVEDVRPTSSAIRFIAYEARRLHGRLGSDQADTLARVLADTTRGMARNFRALPYFQAWSDRHDHALFGSASQRLRAVLFALDHFRVESVGGMLDLYGRAGRWLSAGEIDGCARGAAQEDLNRVGDSELRFVAYGHTHDALTKVLRVDRTQDLYLNSGTWRERQFAADDGAGFVGSELCTWLAFFTRDETPADVTRAGPGYTSWTGTRKVLDHGAIRPRGHAPSRPDPR